MQFIEIPSNLRYTKNHIWVRSFRNNAYAGITDYFQHSIGLIDLIDLPAGNAYAKGEICGEIYTPLHKRKIIMPLSGLISCVNTGRMSAPHVFNQSPYSNWMMIIPSPNPEELNQLLSPADYKMYTYCFTVNDF